MSLQSLVTDDSSQYALKYAVSFELTTRHDCHHWLESLTWMICALTCVVRPARRLGCNWQLQ